MDLREEHTSFSMVNVWLIQRESPVTESGIKKHLANVSTATFSQKALSPFALTSDVAL